jgi:hypothetical protein
VRVTDQYVEDSVRTFYERVEMMVLACIEKRARRPLLVMAHGVLDLEGWMSAYVPTDRDHPHPEVTPGHRELARHAGRAWRTWTKLEPDGVVVTLRVYASDPYISVTITPRTAEVEWAIERAVRTSPPAGAPW